MSNGVILLAERHAVLVVVRAVLHHSAYVYHALCRLEIARVACLAVHLGNCHVVRRAHGVACQCLGVVFIERAEEVGCLNGAVV